MATSAKTTLKTAILAVITDAETIIALVEDGTVTRADAYESKANAVREDIADLLPQISATWGVDGWPACRALRGLAARLLDLREAVTNDAVTVDVTVDHTTSLIELAVARYRDFSRWTDLAALNPDLPHPGFIRPGTTVVVYVQ